VPTFNAGAIAEDLDYDFTDAGVKGTKGKGTVPEPSDRLIGDFLDEIKVLYEKAREAGLAELPEDATPDEMLAAVTQVTGDKFVTFMADTAAIFARLCQNRPDAETLLKLPLRVRVAFYGWLQGQVVNPEAGPGAGTQVLRALPSQAAG
jgi:hypothetical protein